MAARFSNVKGILEGEFGCYNVKMIEESKCGHCIISQAIWIEHTFDEFNRKVVIATYLGEEIILKKYDYKPEGGKSLSECLSNGVKI